MQKTTEGFPSDEVSVPTSFTPDTKTSLCAISEKKNFFKTFIIIISSDRKTPEVYQYPPKLGINEIVVD